MKYWEISRERWILKRYINITLGYQKHLEFTHLPVLVSLVDPNLILPKHYTDTKTLFFNVPLKSDFDNNVLNHCCTWKMWPYKCWKRCCCTSTAFKTVKIATATILTMIIALHLEAFWKFTRYSTFVFKTTVTSILTKRKPKKKLLFTHQNYKQKKQFVKWRIY